VAHLGLRGARPRERDQDGEKTDETTPLHDLIDGGR
jgi:hypothetical protein